MNPDTQAILDLVNLALGWAAGNVTEIQSVRITDQPNGTGTAAIVLFQGTERVELEAFVDYEDLDAEWQLTKAPGL